MISSELVTIRSVFTSGELKVVEDPLQIKEYLLLEAPISTLSIKSLFSLYTKLLAPSLLLGSSYLGHCILASIGYNIANSTGDNLIQSSFGLAVFFNNITVSNFTYGIVEKMSIATSSAFGKQDYNGVRLAFTQGLVVYILMFAFLCFPSAYFAEDILLAVGMRADNAALASGYYWKFFLVDSLMSIAYFLMSFCSSQGIEGHFALIVNVILVISIVAMWSLNSIMNLQMFSYFIGRCLYDALCIIVLGYIYFKKSKPETQGLSSLKDVFNQDFWTYLKDCLTFSSGMYVEFAGWEICNYFTGILKDKDQLAALTCLVNVAYYVFYLGYGFACVARTRISNLLAKGYSTAAKNFTTMFMVGTVGYSLTQMVAIWIFHPFIVSFYTGQTTKETQQYFSQLLWYYSIFQISDTIFYPIFTVCRTRGLAAYTLAICAILLIGAQSITASILVSIGTTCLGILLNTYSMFFIGYIIILYMLYVHFPWEGQAEQTEAFEMVKFEP